jgi:glutamine synthetase
MKVEYIWIGGISNETNKIFGIDPYSIRSKTKIIDKEVVELNDLPIWNYDGSSTNQASTDSSEIYIIPRKIYRDPFRNPNVDILVLCDTWILGDDGYLIPHSTNNRHKATIIFDDPKISEQEPLFGLEQEFFVFDYKKIITSKKFNRQGQYYCSNGSQNALNSAIVEKILNNCITAGITISGMNSEVAPEQWELQIGPCSAINGADDLWMMRYIAERTTNDTDYIVSFHPKPMGSEWSGSGCHCNFSTKIMRNDNGINEIYNAINRLKNHHNDMIKLYGKYNEQRLTGIHETSSISKFSYGIADRTTSIRIPKQCAIEKKGYFEDRRPASNMDPYIVTSLIAKYSIYE